MGTRRSGAFGSVFMPFELLHIPICHRVCQSVAWAALAQGVLEIASE